MLQLSPAVGLFLVFTNAKASVLIILRSILANSQTTKDPAKMTAELGPNEVAFRLFLRVHIDRGIDTIDNNKSQNVPEWDVIFTSPDTTTQGPVGFQ